MRKGECGGGDGKERVCDCGMCFGCERNYNVVKWDARYDTRIMSMKGGDDSAL